MATSLQCGHRVGFVSRHIMKQVGKGPVARRLCPLVRAIRRTETHRVLNEKGNAGAPQASATAIWQRAAASIVAGFCTALSVSLPAWAGTVDPNTAIVGPSADDLLGAGPDFSFTALLMFTLLGYWLVKALVYLTKNSPDGPDPGPDGDGQQRPGSGNDLSDIGHAHIRSYVDSSQPGPDGRGADARKLRNASLARSAAYRVTATLRESQPRIHSLVEELAGSQQHDWPPRPPRNADVDFVAQMVYNRVVQERAAKGPEHALGPREVAALETRVLEEVAERVAAEQVAEFIRMAAQGTLHPRGPGGGSGPGADHHPPRSHAHH